MDTPIWARTKTTGASVRNCLTKVTIELRETMKTLIVTVALVLTMLGLGGGAICVVVDFEDAPTYILTDTGYAGLIWEWGSLGYGGFWGYWALNESSAYSGNLSATNYYGSRLIGIRFPERVNVAGAYFSSNAAAPLLRTTGVRVHGYRSGAEVAVTDWFTDMDTQYDWFAISLNDVDRIVFESVPVYQNAGVYAMDDLTYEPIPEPSSLATLGLSLLPLGTALMRRRKLH